MVNLSRLWTRDSGIELAVRKMSVYRLRTLFAYAQAKQVPAAIWPAALHIQPPILN